MQFAFWFRSRPVSSLLKLSAFLYQLSEQGLTVLAPEATASSARA